MGRECDLTVTGIAQQKSGVGSGWLFFVYLPLYPLTIAARTWRAGLWNALLFLFHSSLDRWPMETKMGGGGRIGGDRNNSTADSCI